MKLRGPLTLAARVLLCLAAAACEDDNDFLIDDQRTDFQATLTTINDTIPILDPNTEGVSGEASFQVDEGDDLFTATVEAEGLAPSIEHLQFVFDGGSCPPSSADVNGDGFVDVVEGSAFFGEILIALDDDLGTRSGGSSVFPFANANGEIDYEESADLQSVLEALPSQLPNGGLQLGSRTDTGDRDGVVWFCTLDQGLLKFDRERARFVRYRLDPAESNTLPHYTVLTAFEDAEGVLWVGTQRHVSGLKAWAYGLSI